MLFKKRTSVTPSWWEAVDRKQKIYAHRLADWLAKMTAGMPVKQFRLWVAGVLVFLAVVNLWMGIQAVRECYKASATSSYVLPAPVGAPRSRPHVRQLHRGLQEYLDSLRRDSSGSRLLDGLLRTRPGLADTLRRVEGVAP